MTSRPAVHRRGNGPQEYAPSETACHGRLKLQEHIEGVLCETQVPVERCAPAELGLVRCFA